VDQRADRLQQLLGGDVLKDEEGRAAWAPLRTLTCLQGRLLWRIVVPPSAGWRVIEDLRPVADRWIYDWAGGLVWLTTHGPDAAVRVAAEQHGGQAMLVRAEPEVRASVPAFHPATPAVAALMARVRHGFDPAGVFVSGRFEGATVAN
jgi:glycolate oxidase FAD binding subunit